MTVAQDVIKKLQQVTGWEGFSSNDPIPTFQNVLDKYTRVC